ncbi:hypothetical protein GOBAR_AA00788 [Gossypium barbadense]|uniref:Uncharacterized protein n=1 Tax=Gossypium barbadense TaxID=3634 RepID=A0A2P5YW78_GOSBA|nr:hypothetical protein GOBAR_AA00788 [Gossypium barbadense]
MVTLYCGTRSNQNVPIELFAELAGVEPTEDPTPLGEEHGAQKPCMVVPISYVDSQLTIREINIDFNVAPENDVVGHDVYHSSDPFNHEVDSDSDLDVDEVPDDIDDKCMNDDENVNASSVEFVILLLAVAQDGNKNVLPIAFAIIDKENMESHFGVPWRSVYYIRHITTSFHRDYKNENWRRQVVRMGKE